MPLMEPIITGLSYCITKLGTNNLNNDDGVGGTTDNTTNEELDGDVEEKLTHARFSTEIWLRIFNKLDRNEIDNCEHVCVNWRQIILSNKKLLPPREIDYIIISSKRIYSIIIASNNIIKTYRFVKYYDAKNINGSVNDKSNMLVQTHRRRRAPPKKEAEKPPFQFYLDELTDLHIHVAAPAKTRLKLGSPPQMFFQKLNDLLRNHSIVQYLVFRNLTLTNSFITKFMLHIRPINAIGTCKFISVRRDKILPKALSTLLILLNDGKNENVDDLLPPGESRMITFSF